MCSEYVSLSNNYSMIDPSKASYQYNDIITIACVSGFVLSGDNRVTAQLQCGNDERWHILNGDVSECRPIKCAQLVATSQHLLIHTGGQALQFGTAVKFSCRLGYMLIGNSTTLCQNNGQWSQPVPVCEKIMCDDILNETQFSDDITDVLCHCPNGHRAVNGSSRIHRLSSGQWNDSIARCELILCAIINELNNGSFTSTGTSDIGLVNSTVQAACDDGFVLLGPDTVECMADGDWQPYPDWACARTCGHPPGIANGSYHGGQLAGNSVQYECDFSYYLAEDDNTSAVIYCAQNGMWSADSAPSCIYIECEEVNITDNMLNFMTAGSGLNKTIQYSCSDTDYSVSSEMSKCTWNGTAEMWEPLPGKVKCTEGEVLFGINKSTPPPPLPRVCNSQ